ncbi:MAG TPA: HPr kinase/phosphatase C-terminal domain-containing protein [Candidatus Polarisedimenticolia bacterium]|jgi:HPr kinase/phosphorylase|nr:HPr kinase/phosphatase C-terminal domain-containing protein [Dongiaceae bacterium]HYV89815.1 HPr kinase/phosphatase C-terminal domain-containing protein [Candidatus Polarisedimenticolia bacterium]
MSICDPMRLQLHGTAVAIEGQGLLLRGPSGAGKSDLAWRLIEAGAVLIADDLCEIRRQGDRLIIDLPAAVDSRFRGAIERRGLGIDTVPWFGPAPLALVADLATGPVATEAPESLELLGLALPLVVLDPFQPSAIPLLRRMALPQLVD